MSNKSKIVTPSILPGFMELLPEEQMEFNRMRSIIEEIYQNSGFSPIETPLIEKNEILLAKGGGETEKQIYGIDSKSKDMSLRFDLTVPLARYVSQHFSDLQFPFRRYQIEKVFRGERNQKGRYREFYQSDIDIIGHNSLSPLYDAEIPSIIYRIFTALGFEAFKIHINNRKILNGLFDYLEINDTAKTLQILDKIDKIGLENIIKLLLEIGLSSFQIDSITDFIQIQGTQVEVIEKLKSLPYINNDIFMSGLNELEELNNMVQAFGVPLSHYVFDLKIARGLDYYTGTVYETYLDDFLNIGSVCSGGRYDNLAEYYTKESLPGVGISIGLTRLFYQLNAANFTNCNKKKHSKLLIIPMSQNENLEAAKIASSLRQNKISCEVYMDNSKFKKKMNYANKIGIPFVLILGEDEINSSNYTLKDMKDGIQEKYNLEDLISLLLKK